MLQMEGMATHKKTMMMPLMLTFTMETVMMLTFRVDKINVVDLHIGQKN